eukprot:Tbor_TRINITY_DN5537_c0_g1::TRINITY_DN5537_c0_g1_i2::g.13577::m.13577
MGDSIVTEMKQNRKFRVLLLAMVTCMLVLTINFPSREDDINRSIETFYFDRNAKINPSSKPNPTSQTTLKGKTENSPVERDNRVGRGSYHDVKPSTSSPYPAEERDHSSLEKYSYTLYPIIGGEGNSLQEQLVAEALKLHKHRNSSDAVDTPIASSSAVVGAPTGRSLLPSYHSLKLSEEALERIESGFYSSPFRMAARGEVKGIKNSNQKGDNNNNNNNVACPNRYVIANTHTYGRHHNQLQEIMNVIIWANKMERTAIIGWFRYDHKWIDPRTLYDFSLILENYCAVFPEVMRDRLLRGLSDNTSTTSFSPAANGPITNHTTTFNTNTNSSPDHQSQKTYISQCLGQGYRDMPLYKYLAGVPIQRCPGEKTNAPGGIPPYFSTRNGTSMAREFFLKYVGIPSESNGSPVPDLLVLSGQMSFFIRGGLERTAAIYRLLKPSAMIMGLINDVYEQHNILYTVSSNGDNSSSGSSQSNRRDLAVGDVQSKMSLGITPPVVRSHQMPMPSSLSTRKNNGMFGIHARRREKMCRTEVEYEREDSRPYLSNLSTQAIPGSDEGKGKLHCNNDIIDKNTKNNTTSSDRCVRIVPVDLQSYHWDVLATQCFITIKHVMKVIKDTIPSSTSSLRVFLATDGQDPKFDNEMKISYNAVVINGSVNSSKKGQQRVEGITALAVDFFILAESLYFTGNQMSSVTQNVCFIRLGRGLSCDGYIPYLTQYLSRSIF